MSPTPKIPSPLETTVSKPRAASPARAKRQALLLASIHWSENGAWLCLPANPPAQDALKEQWQSQADVMQALASIEC